MVLVVGLVVRIEVLAGRRFLGEYREIPDVPIGREVCLEGEPGILRYSMDR